MRDFFARQRAAKRSSLLLYLYFVLALALFGSVLAVSVYIFFYTSDLQRLYTHPTPFNFSPSEWDYQALLRVALVIFALIMTGSLYKYFRLRSGGGSLIAQMLGGRVIYPDTQDFYERRLLNIIEEMAIASGVTVPSVFLLDHEWGINAFAAGFTEEDAVFGVTKGALSYLNREELQGVIAHEFSHVLNGDMLVNIRLQGLLHGVLVIGLLGEALIKSFVNVESLSQDRDNQGGAGAGAVMLIIGTLLYAVGYTGVFVGRMIKSAVSRQREFLADAAAVQFTRNPLGLAGALMKIGGLSSGSQIRAPRASEISHMYFGNAISGSWFNMFSTHPPLLDRIKRLDPEFRGTFPEQVKPVEIDPEEAMMYAAASAGQRMGTGAGGVIMPVPQGHVLIHSLMAGNGLLAAMRSPDLPCERFKLEVLDNFPRAVREAVECQVGALAVFYEMLLAEAGGERLEQNLLAQRISPEVRAEMERLRPEMARMLPECRLYLADYALPALKNLADKEYKGFLDNVRKMVASDGQVSVFEYTCYCILVAKKEGGSTVNIPEESLAAISQEVSCLLTFLARQGNADESEARKAVMRSLRGFGKDMKRMDFLAPARSSFKKFDLALRRLAGCSLAMKSKIFDACLVCVAEDEIMTLTEAELLRGIVETLSCPVPKWLKLSVGESLSGLESDLKK